MQFAESLEELDATDDSLYLFTSNSCMMACVVIAMYMALTRRKYPRFYSRKCVHINMGLCLSTRTIIDFKWKDFLNH